jgi:diguanylate cyclase (GGDEF)-like protein
VLGLLGLVTTALPACAADALLRLGPADTQRNLWDAARVLPDPGGQLTLGQVLDRTADFRAPAPPLGNLGRRSGAVWMRVPLQRADGAAQRWMLEFDYPPLDRIDVYLLDGRRVEQHAVLGDHVDMHARVLPTRSHVMLLDLPSTAPRALWVRVQSVGTLLVPAQLLTPSAYQAREASEQALQGVLVGMGLCMLVYTLAQWALLREAIFGMYAMAVLGTVGFFAALSGVGPQHLWGASTWLTRNAPAFAILVGVCGATFFIRGALNVCQLAPRLAHVVAGFGVISGATALLFAVDLIGYTSAQSVGMALGVTPLLLVLPLAWRCLRAGDRAAPYMLLGWAVYAVGVLVIVGLLLGWMPLNFWTLHAFQFATLFEMSMWMLVLGERAQALRRSATKALSERDLMRSLAHTDGLTGLLNRRGLEESMPLLLNQRTVSTCVALFLLDLDGFKEVNDTHGHDVGDALLRSVAHRLQSTVRAPHLVCRLGGDEFVVAVGALRSATDATAVGLKLLHAFDAPLDMPGTVSGPQPRRQQGVTLGYALAPQDAQELTGLLKCADAGLYAGKQAGKHCVRRGTLGGPRRSEERLAQER